ncbi:hypothetical protein A0U90_08580 [Kozakia baliensis]|nr:hypothetical protein A0U90_08580 [Kozakia baliensis]
MEILAVVGSFLGIIASFAAGSFPTGLQYATIVAPMGASAVLVFAVPASPLATPRAVILGNALSAAIGVLVSILVPTLPLACALAVALAIGGMFVSRSLHPPGGASALTAVLAQPAAHGWVSAVAFPFLPVGLNAVFLVLAGVLFHRVTGHTYPHIARLPIVPDRTGHFRREDIQVALGQLSDRLDVSLADLEELFVLTEQAAERREKQGVSKNG